jgi:transcription initiation factor IIE alpha subunit
MKEFFLLLPGLASSLVIFAQTTNSSTKKSDSSKVTYTCTMHPDVITEQPGKCPKCGMMLAEKKSKAKPDEHNR